MMAFTTKMQKKKKARRSQAIGQKSDQQKTSRFLFVCTGLA